MSDLGISEGPTGIKAPRALPKRMLTGVLMFIGLCASFWVDHRLYDETYGLLLTSLLAIIVVIGLYEFYSLAERAPCRPLKTWGIGGGVALVFAHWLTLVAGAPESLGAGQRLGGLVGLICCALLFGMFAEHALKRGVDGVLENVGVTILGLVYVAFLGSYMMETRHLGGNTRGALSLLLLIFVSEGADIGAYCFGKLLGGKIIKRRLAPAISPNKSVEGALGGLLFGVVIALLSCPLMNGLLGWRLALLFGLVIGTASQLGDLAESLLKRAVGAKDSSNILPGSGGVLDLIDCLLLSAPAAYFFFQFSSG